MATTDYVLIVDQRRRLHLLREIKNLWGYIPASDAVRIAQWVEEGRHD